MDIDRRFMAAFARWQAGRDGSWFDLGREYMQRRFPHWECLARENTYNVESDLDQCFVFEVWGEPGSDWAYLGPEESMVVVYVHTGCDVRGGYGQPIFCHSRGGEYALPLDWVAGFYPVEARMIGGGPVDPWQVPDIDRLSIGYSSHPMSELEDFADRIFWFTLTPETGTVIVRHGDYLVKLAPEARTE